MKIYISLTAIILLFTSCVGIKYLKPGEAILYDQEIKSTGNLNKDALEGLLTQKPNKKLLETKLFGLMEVTVPIAHRVYIYHWGKKNYDSLKLVKKRERIENKYDRKIAQAKSPGKRSRLREKRLEKIEDINTKLSEGNLRMRFGEELAVFDPNAVETSVQKLKSYLFSKGYFNAEVKAKIDTVEQRLLETTYTINEKEPYIIDSVFYSIKDPEVKKIFIDNLEDQKLRGEKYDETTISQERTRVYELMVNSGYYDFKRQYILFEVDSTILGDKKLVVRESILNPPDKKQHKLFRLDSVIFSGSAGAIEDRYRQLEVYNDVTYDFSSEKYPERLLDWRIFIEKDSLYSKNLTLQTQRQLSYLDMYKFVNINYDTTGGKFIANIYTSPLKRFQTSSELGLSVIEGPYPGPFFNFNAKSRNLFKGLEIIQFDANASISGIQSVQGESNYTRFQYGGQFSATFPQFLFPLRYSLRKRIGRYNPRTKFATGLNFEDRINEYQRIILNGNMSYIWQARDNMQFTLKPTDISYIWSETYGKFEETLKEQPLSLSSAFDPSFVTFTSVAIDYQKNNYILANTSASFIRGFIETGGNILALGNHMDLIDEAPFGSDLEYYKYLKANIDFRKKKRINEATGLAYRLNVGAAYVYGDNNALPYEKYFFAGGSNSIRAWQPRRLGPGAFGTYDQLNERGQIVVDHSLEKAGDILFEASVEFRKDLVGFIEYALFVDAGNIWLWKSETVEAGNDGFPSSVGQSDLSTLYAQNDDGEFTLRTFPREIAVGAGFGLRFDFSFLLLRADVAYKVVDPAYPLGERFVLGNYTRLSDLWSAEKATLNIGIGYPF